MGTPGQWCLQGSGSQKWSLQVSEPSPAHNKFSSVWGVSDLIQGGHRKVSEQRSGSIRSDLPEHFSFSLIPLLSLLGHHVFASVCPQIALCDHA